MKHKKLLENVMIDLLKDPTCPIYQYQDWQLTNICQQLQLQNFSNVKEQDFQRKFAQFFIKYLEAENEIDNILEQSSIKRNDSKKNNEDHSNQNNLRLQSKSLIKSIKESNKEINDQIDTLKNKKRVKLKQSNTSDLLDIEENPCTHNSVNLDIMEEQELNLQIIPQDQKLSQYSFDPINDNHHNKNVNKKRTQKIISNKQILMESIIERKDRDQNQELNPKKKNNNTNDFKNQNQSHSIFKSTDYIETKKQLQVEQQKEERENNKFNDKNQINEQNSRKNKQIQIQKKPSRAIIDSSPEDGEIVIQISDPESQKQKNIQDLRKKQGKYQMDDQIQIKSNKLQQSENNYKQKTFNQQKNKQNKDFNQDVQAQVPLNQNQHQPTDGIEFQIQKQKQLLENQYSIIQSQPAYQKSDNYEMNLEKNNQNSSLTNTSNSIIQQKNSLSDIQNVDCAIILNPLIEISKDPSNYIAQNLQINKNDYLGVNLQRNNQHLKSNNQYWNQNQNQNNQFPYQLQSHIQNTQIPNQMYFQSNVYPQSGKNDNRIFEGGQQNLELLKEKKPKIESLDINNNSLGNGQFLTENKYLQIKTNLQQCNYCKQIDGKVKLVDIEDEVKICSSCLLEKLNPFRKIVNTLGFLEYQYQQKSQSKINLDFTIAQDQFLIPGMQLEIRCVMMNKNGLTDFTFPNSCILLINGVIIKEFKPLIEKSCLKKRKDNSILINLDSPQKTFGMSKKYTFTCVEVIPDSQMRQEIPKQIYIFGLFLVQNQSLDQVIHSIVNQSTENTIY